MWSGTPVCLRRAVLEAETAISTTEDAMTSSRTAVVAAMAIHDAALCDPSDQIMMVHPSRPNTAPLPTPYDDSWLTTSIVCRGHGA